MKNAVTRRIDRYRIREERAVDTAVIKYYRNLLKTGFQNAGSLETPSLLLETIGEGRVCGSAGDYMRLFISITNGRIDRMKYLCTCDPTANVAVETLCNLAKDKSLKEAQAITEDSVLQMIGGSSGDLRSKARGLIDMLNEGLAKYQMRNQSHP